MLLQVRAGFVLVPLEVAEANRSHFASLGSLPLAGEGRRVSTIPSSSERVARGPRIAPHLRKALRITTFRHHAEATAVLNSSARCATNLRGRFVCATGTQRAWSLSPLGLAPGRSGLGRSARWASLLGANHAGCARDPKANQRWFSCFGVEVIRRRFAAAPGWLSALARGPRCPRRVPASPAPSRWLAAAERT